MNYQYDEPKEASKTEFTDIVRTGDVAMICDAIVRAVYFIPDYDWLLKQYILLSKHPDLEVRGVTITCIGHLARLNGKANKTQLLEILKPLLANRELSGRVEDAIDDVNAYL